MGVAFPIDPNDPRKLFYLDPSDYRRRRPGAVWAGSAGITMYLRRELKAAGESEGNVEEQLNLCVYGWRLVDRIRTQAKGGS